ncbi:DUF5606 domain-containing protein [Hymenobacter sp. BT491]|uniref:DUF5606 family protein n=1 Tax=Hymenobacter sp. BT491 TaxID=2766779 RepID=UPI001653D66A|nr:DUF5606 domain-containing protein [Hymenobacter sp. BT491]MBC6990226.1 DUF5606 domain-containing protein [Hymenobacter sp. BT491]
MPYDLKEIAAISGMPGLYRLVRPTRAGVIVESLDERAARSVASARNKVSLLQEISIYTQDYDQTVPLTEAFDRVYQKYGTELPVNSKSDDRDLVAFMEETIPDYDRQRVYMSDIKKLVTWYKAVSSNLEYQAAGNDSQESDNETDTESTQQDTPAADEALSTAGIISAEEESSAPANPEAATKEAVSSTGKGAKK